MSDPVSHANFNPGQLTLDVANLAKQVGDIQEIITGKADFKISEVVEAVDALGRVVGDFVPRVAQLEALISPLLPLIPVLEKQFSGESAGVGSTQTQAVEAAEAIPAEQLGNYSDPPAPAPAVVEQPAAEQIPGTA